MTVVDMADFIGSYDRYFAVIRADSAELLDHAYRVRYQVYCVENQFEDPGQHADGRETDGDDDRSVHVLLVHRHNGEAAGTARVILPVPADMRRPLPVQRLLNSTDRHLFQRLPLHRTAEISRFAVSKQFRRRRGEALYPDAGFPLGSGRSVASERRLMPYITFGLLRGVLDICLEYGITHLTALMDPSLIRILVRLGLDFEPLGRLVAHHGMRQPCMADLGDLIHRSHDSRSLLWSYVGQESVGRRLAPTLPAIDPRREAPLPISGPST